MQHYFFIDAGKRYVKVSFADIIYIEACRNYVRLVTTKGSLMALLSMRQIVTMLPPEKFCRIHRSYIVSIDSIQSFVSDKVFMQDKTLPIGESYNKALQQRITIVTSDYPRDGKKISGVLESVISNQN